MGLTMAIRSTDPPQPPRVGPRPLWLHLGTAAMSWSSAALPAALWASSLRGTDPRMELLTMIDLATRRYGRLATGIVAYQTHPYRRAVPAPPVLWRCEGMAVLDYGEDRNPGAPPILIVPSLINKHYILDLHEEQSFVRALAHAGYRPLLVAWDGFAGASEPVTIDACVSEKLAGALTAILAATRQRPVLLGYCLGGLLALALAALRPGEVAALAFMATPWDFHAGDCRLAQAAPGALAMIEPVLQMLGHMPVDAVQSLFYAIDPFQVIEKFLRFAEIAPASEEAARFVALEDWLNDGLPLAAPVARTLLGEWYGGNAPARGAWSVGGVRIDPSHVSHPAFAMLPSRDRIVPPASAEALALALPHAEAVTVDAGHIGMVSSRHAPRTVWPLLLHWLQKTLAPTA